MPSKLDELKRRAQQTARDLDEKYKLKSKLDEGTRKTTEALRKGADMTKAPPHRSVRGLRTGL